MKYESWQWRVIQERDDLKEKIHKLTQFLDTPILCFTLRSNGRIVGGSVNLHESIFVRIGSSNRPV